jgi:hypothetical protein
VSSLQWVRGIARQLGPFLAVALVLPGGFLLAALFLVYQRFGPCWRSAVIAEKGCRPVNVTVSRASLSITNESWSDTDE